MEKREELYRGKAKTVHATDDPRYLVMHYRDDVSAFDGVKLAKLDKKGETNNRINAYVMEKLAAAGVATHFVRLLNERESLVKAMKMIPVECVVRNVVAGSMAKRYGIEEGTRLREPIFEFFLKSDALHDPLCNDDHIRVLGWASADEIAQMKAMTHKVNAWAR
jgi:phosphoribosylaminoimidazole-succinocarboxamide synthase